MGRPVRGASGVAREAASPRAARGAWFAEGLGMKHASRFLPSLVAPLLLGAWAGCGDIDPENLGDGGPRVDVLLVGGSAYVHACDAQLFGCADVFVDATVDLGDGRVEIPAGPIDVDDEIWPYFASAPGGAPSQFLIAAAPEGDLISATIDGVGLGAAVVAPPDVSDVPATIQRAAGPVVFTAPHAGDELVAWHHATCAGGQAMAVTLEVDGDQVTLRLDEVGDQAGDCVHTLGLGSRTTSGTQRAQLLVTSTILTTFTSTPAAGA